MAALGSSAGRLAALVLALALAAPALGAPILSTRAELDAYLAEPGNEGRRVLLCSLERVGDCDLIERAYEVDESIVAASVPSDLLPEGAHVALDGEVLVSATAKRRRLMEDGDGGALSALNAALGKSIALDGSGAAPDAGRVPEVERALRERGLAGGARFARDSVQSIQSPDEVEARLHYASMAKKLLMGKDLNAELQKAHRILRFVYSSVDSRKEATRNLNRIRFMQEIENEVGA